MLTAQPFAATPRTDSSVSGSSHSDSLEKKPEDEADAQGWATASAPHPSLVWWRRAVLPSLPWVVRFLSFFYIGCVCECVCVREIKLLMPCMT